jgi:endonuclease/exonuclease/phosphatase family metal-dependent hydrolase
MLLFMTPWLGAGAQEPGNLPPAAIDRENSGQLSLLNYNVHGLPAGLAGDRPNWRIHRIAPLLSEHQVVALQETFSVHKTLDKRLAFLSSVHARQRRCGVPAGPGLSTYAQIPIQESLFVPFGDCHGVFGHANDCLANKGLLLTRLELPGTGGHGIDLYNLHLDAGTHSGDIAVRTKQVEVLLAAISDHSSGHAVVVVGDLNEAGLGPVTKALEDAGLEEACDQSHCGKSSHVERFFLRSSTAVSLRSVSWTREPAFVDERGRPLSDHPALSLTLAWSLLAPL